MSLPDLLFYILAALTGASAIGVVLTQNIVRAATWLLFTLAGTAGIFFLLGAEFIGATQLLIYVGGTLVLVVFGVMLTAQGPFINMKIGAAEWAIGLAVGLLFFGVLAVTLRISVPPVTREARLAGKEKITALVATTLDTAAADDIPPNVTALRDAALALVAQDQVPREDVIDLIRVEQTRWLTEKETPKGSLLRLPLDEAVGLAMPPSKFLGAALLGDTRVTPEMRMTGSSEARNRYRAKMGYLLPFEIVSVHLLVVLIGAAYLARAKRRRAETVK